MQGYDHDHKDIELLRLRNFTMGKRLADNEIVGSAGLDRVAELIRSMVPFVSVLISSLVLFKGGGATYLVKEDYWIGKDGL